MARSVCLLGVIKLNKRQIYVASSWRNKEPYFTAVEILDKLGHEVFDFKLIPFLYGNVDKNWQEWTVDQYIESFKHPEVQRGFNRDREALMWCDTLVLVLPCGRSAHLEAGHAMGAGKEVYIVLADHQEPELMYGMAKDLLPTVNSLREVFKITQ